jgi:hypothetical protein
MKKQKRQQHCLINRDLRPGEIRDYRILLEAAFTARRKRQTIYSLKHFAKDMGIITSQLSEILKGEKGLSHAKAREVSKRLALTTWAAERFCYLVAEQSGRSKYVRNIAKMALQRKLIRDADLKLKKEMECD